MTDTRRRELERAKAGGDMRAAADLLVARVRCGEIDSSGLEIAAFLGDPVAREVVGDRFKLTRTPKQVLRRLARWGRECLIVTGRLVMGEDLQRYWTSSSLRNRAPQEAINAALEWAECPCLRHARACARAAEVCRDCGALVGGRVPRTAASLAELALADHPDEFRSWARAKDVVGELSEFYFLYSKRRLLPAAELMPAEVVSDLRLWALGKRSFAAFRV